MSKEFIYAVIDVEGTKDQNMYDFAVTLCTKTKIIESYNALVEEVYTDAVRMKGAHYANKYYTEYPLLMSNTGLKIKPLAQIKEETNKLFSNHDISYLTAYNLLYDSSSIGKTCQRVLGERFLNEPVAFFDMWAAACQTVCQTKAYKSFCIKNGFVTEAGNLNTSAEVVMRYIINNPLFVEDHTALSDTLIEVQILQKILRTRKKFSKNELLKSPWKLVN